MGSTEMERVYDDFETYKRRIWNSTGVTAEPYPHYAYFCWRWDTKRWINGEGAPYPRVSDPIEDQDFKNGMLLLLFENSS